MSQIYKLLLFDDDYSHLQYLKDYLTTIEEYEVVLTADKDVTLRLQTEIFDLICIDIMIQHESLNEHNEVVDNIQFDGIPWQQTGLEFLRRLRTGFFYADGGTPSNVPALILSATSELPPNSPIDEAWLEKHKVEKIEKPFDLEIIIEKISDLLTG